MGSTPIECINLPIKRRKKSKSCLYSFIVIVFNVLSVKNIIYILEFLDMDSSLNHGFIFYFCQIHGLYLGFWVFYRCSFYSYLDFIQ